MNEIDEFEREDTKEVPDKLWGPQKNLPTVVGGVFLLSSLLPLYVTGNVISISPADKTILSMLSVLLFFSSILTGWFMLMLVPGLLIKHFKNVK